MVASVLVHLERIELKWNVYMFSGMLRSRGALTTKSAPLLLLSPYPAIPKHRRMLIPHSSGNAS